MSDLIIHGDPAPPIAVNCATAVEGVRRFEYGSLPLEKAQALRESRARIHTEIKKTAESVIAIGRELIAVKKALPHGAFQALVESECGFSLRTAENYMRVARLADKNATVAFLPLGTAYRLTGRRPSRWMLNAAAERVADGEDMTEAAFERLYKMFTDSKARRARRKSRGLDQNADISKSDLNARAGGAVKHSGPGSVPENSRTERRLSDAEHIESGADWIFRTLGQRAHILRFWHRKGMLPKILDLVGEKLRRLPVVENVDQPEEVN